MKKARSSLFGVCVALAGWTAPAFADDSAAACGRIVDNVQRLACYDARFGKSATTSPTYPATPSAAPTTPPDASTQAATPPKSKDAAGASGDFGGEFKSQHYTGPKRLIATVSEAAPLGRGLFRLTLDNGQVWQTTEADWALEFHDHNSITIERMALGNYLISRTGGRQTVAIKRVR